jgi:hypothetical protein
MRIDAVLPQQRRAVEMAPPPQNKVAAERKPPGEAGDVAKIGAKAHQPQQINAYGSGSKVSILA